jgi:hypothetical protein
MSKAMLYNDTPYLPFAAHDTQTDASLEVPKKDIAVLRELGSRIAEIAALPEQKTRVRLWKDINDLKGGRPLVWVNEVSWHEMNVEDELTLRCESTVGFRLENQLRRTLYQWKHMRGDMVLENMIEAPYIIRNTGFGIKEQADIRETNADAAIASRHFYNQITCMEDIQKIKNPVITLDKARTEAFFDCYSDIFRDILPVRTKGCSGFWYAPWDDIVLFMGAENVLLALWDDPELMHALIERLTDAYSAALDQYVALGLTASNNCNVRVGSGAYGYTDDLAADGGGFCEPLQMWGNATPQIFGSVSPAMHKEFGVDYEMKWLKRFGLNYYGCCEPLHNRFGILSGVPNLRKVSISPWANTSAAAENMRGRYVVSLKPSSALLAAEVFDEDAVRKELSGKFAILKGCCTEVVIKDISTVRGESARLWRWVEIALEEARRFE